MRSSRSTHGAKSRPGARLLGELAALSGIAIAQPILDVMGRSPDFFIFRRATRSDIVAMALFVVVAPAAVLWVVEWLAALLLGPRAGRRAHVAAISALVSLVALQVLKDVTPVRGVALALSSVVVGAVAAHGYRISRGLRSWLVLMAPSGVVFAALFLLVSPVSQLILPARSAAAGAPARAPKPVVMVVFDELPLMTLLDSDGTINRRLFPNFARLASGSMWLRNTTGVAGYTPVALPPLLTGQWPVGSPAPAAAQYPENLFSLLAPSHRLAAYETISALCPPTACDVAAPSGPTGTRALLSDAVRVWAEVVAPRESRRDITQSLAEETAVERPAPADDEDVDFGFAALEANQPARFNEFLADIDGEAPPTFWFLHLLMPHAPWRYLPSGLQYETRQFGKDSEDRWLDQPSLVVHQQQRHLLQAVYTDGLLGQLIDKLEREGLYDEAVLVVAADHGVGLVGGEKARSLEDENAAGLAWVPLFVRTPGENEGVVRDDNTFTIDIVPTVADALEARLPWDVDGISLLGRDRRPAGEKRFIGTPTRELDTGRFFPEVLGGTSAALAGPAADVAALLRSGPAPALIGEATPDGGAVAGTAVVADLAAYETVDPASGSVPALVTGALDVEATTVAVALNGRIVATAGTFIEAGERRFAAVVPDAAFRRRDNDLELFVVGTSGRLSRLDVRG